MIEIRSRYDEHERPRGFSSTRPTMTQQHFKDECDINKIMQQYQDYGTPIVDPLAHRSGQPVFDDFSDLPDLQTAQNKLIEAQALFMSLPSSIRRRFDNDPVRFVEFCQNADNVAEMRELGLLPTYYYDKDGDEYYIESGVPYYTGRKNTVEPAEKTEAVSSESA